MKNILVRVLLVVTLLLLALTVYNNKVIDSKSKEVLAIQEKQKETVKRLERISGQLDVLNVKVEEANKSYKALSEKLSVIDRKKNTYSEEVRKIKNANEDTEIFLDRKLPDDFKRLLNDAVSE